MTYGSTFVDQQMLQLLFKKCWTVCRAVLNVELHHSICWTLLNEMEINFISLNKVVACWMALTNWFPVLRSRDLVGHEAAAANDGEESSLLWMGTLAIKGSQHTITTTFRHPPFPNLPPKVEIISNSRSTKFESVYSYSETSRNKTLTRRL